jgi:hypothetical protein
VGGKNKTYDHITKITVKNQIMLSQHKQAQKLMKKYHYAKDELLQPNQVGVYFFDAQSRNSQAIKVTETGFEVSSIDKMILPAAPLA